MPTVLIIATDQIIGGLLGQLAELAGHATQFRRTGEPPAEAVRLTRPHVVLADAAYGPATLDAIADAATGVRAPMVYFASTMSAAELRRVALARGGKYFALPAGPKLLRRVLSSALDDVARAADEHALPPGRTAVSAAAAAVARARALADEAAAIRDESRALRAEHDATVAECRRTYADLREAVLAYTRELRSAGVPPDRTLDMVREALRPEVSDARTEGATARAFDDVVEWCLQAYYAA